MPEAAKSPPAQVDALRVWYRFPISLLQPVTAATMPGWTAKPRDRSQTSPSQFTYFHPHIAEALFMGGKDGRFQVFQRDCGPGAWQGEFCKKDDKPLRHTYRRFQMHLDQTELWIAGQDGRTCKGNPAFGILSVAVRITGVAEITKDGAYDARALDGATFGALTLHDAMDALEWVRRVFPRWRLDGDGMPGDSLSQVITPYGTHWPAHTAAAEGAAYQAKGTIQLFPRVKCLLSPLKVDGRQAIHLVDERAFMCSAIALNTPVEAGESYAQKDQKARDLLRAVPDGMLFRLAEADRAGNGDYAYDSACLETLRDRYFNGSSTPFRIPITCQPRSRHDCNATCDKNYDELHFANS